MKVLAGCVREGNGVLGVLGNKAAGTRETVQTGRSFVRRVV